MIVSEIEVKFSEEVVQKPELYIDREGKTGRFFHTVDLNTTTNELEMVDKVLLFHFLVFGAYCCSSKKRAYITNCMINYIDYKDSPDNPKDAITGFILAKFFMTRQVKCVYIFFCILFLFP